LLAVAKEATPEAQVAKVDAISSTKTATKAKDQVAATDVQAEATGKIGPHAAAFKASNSNKWQERAIVKFTYDDEAWVLISTLMHEPDKQALSFARFKLEQMADEYFELMNLSDQILPVTEKRRAWSRVANQSSKLITTIEGVRKFKIPAELWKNSNNETDEELFDRISQILRELMTTAEDAEKVYKSFAGFEGQKNLDREELFEKVFSIWTLSPERKLKFSRSAGGGEPSGPLWFFFQAVLKPILGSEMPKPEGFKEIVIRERGRRSKAVKQTTK
jgi:hypothetical protein